MARRVLVAEFMHETNTFSVQLTDEQAFRNSGYYAGEEVPLAFKGTRTSTAPCGMKVGVLMRCA